MNLVTFGMDRYHLLKIKHWDCVLIEFVNNFHFFVKKTFIICSLHPTCIAALYKHEHIFVAVLTGGNRGLGLEVLKKLLDCNMTVILGKT